MDYLIIAFYHFTTLEDPHLEVKRHHEFLKNLDVSARIYLSFNGINGQTSFLKKDGEAYMEWLKADPRFKDISFKIDPYHEHVLAKVTVKFRPQLVALDYQVDIKNTGKHVPPEEWKKMLDNRDENTVLVDVRNQYEWEIGRFEGAALPQLETFREFPEYVDELSGHTDRKKTKVMMYCTGGIRCELYSALLKEKGFDEVYQLEGGIINYGHKMGNQHWKGTLFVFDDRLSAPISPDEHTLISQCIYCETPCDVYYNCANMDCNELFLSCSSCAEKYLACCCEDCKSADRRRPYEKGERPKPYRKWYNYQKNKDHHVTECGCSE